MEYDSKHQGSANHWEIERLVPTHQPWYRKRLLREHLQRYQFAQKFVKNSIVADIACGSGYGSKELLLGRAKKIYGVDNNLQALTFAKTHFSEPHITYMQSDAIHTSIKTNSVDVVVSFETIEHLVSAKKFILEVKRLLRDQGIFIVSTPNKNFSTGTNHFHVKEYTPEDFVKLLSSFSKVELFGQRQVNPWLFTLLKKVTQIFGFLKFILPFRFWEPIVIVKLANMNEVNYVYLLAVCYI